MPSQQADVIFLSVEEQPVVRRLESLIRESLGQASRVRGLANRSAAPLEDPMYFLQGKLGVVHVFEAYDCMITNSKVFRMR